MRIVALTCSNTEIVCALGCADLLVGVDKHSDHPEDVVRQLPKVGPDLTPDLAKVEALKPDLVLASLTVPGHEKVVEGLERRGLPALVLAPTRLEHVYDDIKTVARALGVAERGDELIGTMRRSLQSSGKPNARPKILVEWWPKPVIVPGCQSWATDLIALAGGQNPWGPEDGHATRFDVKSLPLTEADVLAADPDAVVISWCGVPTEKYRPEVVLLRAPWQELKVVQNKRVFPIAEAFLGRPGPRLVEGFHALQEVVEACRAD